MLKFSLGPGIFNDRFCSDWEFLAEVPAHGIGKKLVPFFLPSSASLDRFVLLDSRGLPWAIDQRLASSRQLELGARQLLPHLFSRSQADAA